MHDKDGKPPVEGNPFEIRKMTIRPLTRGEHGLVAGGTGPTNYTYNCSAINCNGTDNYDYCYSNPDVCPTHHEEQCPSDPAFCNTLNQCTHDTCATAANTVCGNSCASCNTCGGCVSVGGGCETGNCPATFSDCECDTFVTCGGGGGCATHDPGCVTAANCESGAPDCTWVGQC